MSHRVGAKMSRVKTILFVITTTPILFFFQNCSNNYKITTSPESVSALQASSATPPLVIPPTPGSTPSPTTVCNPFGGQTGAAGQGLLTTGIYYLDVASLPSGVSATQAIGNSVVNLLNPNTPDVHFINTNLYLSSINFPDMYFTDGFTDSSGDTLKDSSGNTLVQYFGFQAQSVFVPGSWAPGDYEIATLSDDGSILTMTGGQADGSDFVIDNDGAHAMQMGCTTHILHITANSEIPMTFDYYQGPPVTIGLMMMYRPVSVSGSAQDPLCGKGGDPYYFQDHDSNNNPIPAVPLAPYLQLVGPFDPTTGTGGWKVVEPEHFQLPAGSQSTCP